MKSLIKKLIKKPSQLLVLASRSPVPKDQYVVGYIQGYTDCLNSLLHTIKQEDQAK